MERLTDGRPPQFSITVQEGSKQILSLLLNNARGTRFGPDALSIFRLVLNSYLSTFLPITKNVSHNWTPAPCTCAARVSKQPLIPSVGMEQVL